MTIVGRAIGLFILCVLVGLLLEGLGVTAGGILHDTWNTILAVATKFRDLAAWAVPYALLGAVVVVPLALLNLIGRFRRPR